MTTTQEIVRRKDTIIYDRRIKHIRKSRDVVRGRKDAQGNAVLEHGPEELHIIFEDNLVIVQDAKAVHPAWAVGDNIRFTLKLSPVQGEQS